MLIVKSHYAQLPGERLRSSDYFDTLAFEEGAKLKLTVYYNYFTEGKKKEAPNIIFDLAVNNNDKNKQDAGEEHVYLTGLKSGSVIENNVRENLCIADPDDAMEGFVVTFELAE